MLKPLGSIFSIKSRKKRKEQSSHLHEQEGNIEGKIFIKRDIILTEFV
jgi:hypothetical protein